MNDDQKKILIDKIQLELTTVDSEIKRLEEATKPISPANAIGRVSRMDALGNKMINEQMLAKFRNRKEKLEMVLGNSNTPEFGICEMCLTPIPAERILAIPESTICVRCASH